MNRTACRRARCCDHILMALVAHIRITDMQLDADLRRLEAIALAGLFADALEWMRHRTLRADLLCIGQIVRDLDAREMRWDRFTSAGMLSLVLADLRGALALCLLRG